MSTPSPASAPIAGSAVRMLMTLLIGALALVLALPGTSLGTVGVDGWTAR